MVVFRSAAFTGGAISHDAMIDGRSIGRIRYHSYLSQVITPGKHVFAINYENKILSRSFVAKPGKTTFFKFELTHQFKAKDLAVDAVAAVTLATIGVGVISHGQFGSKLNQVPAGVAIPQLQGLHRA